MDSLLKNNQQNIQPSVNSCIVLTDSLGSSYVSFIKELTHTDNGGTAFEVIG